MKQTAVEWLQELIECGADLEQIKKSLPKAKEMEKQQIIDTYIECKRQYVIQENCYPPQFVVEEAEHYYNEKFKNK